jgi:hypothetical protein
MPKSATKTTAAKVGKAYQILPVVGPSAGVDLRTSPTLLAADRARTLVNYSLAEPGALVVRAGYQAFSTSSLGAQRIQGGARVYLNTAIPNAASTAFTLVGYNGAIYNQSDSGGWSAALLSGLSTNDYSIVSDRDQVAVFDGASTRISKSTNGSSWTRFGIAPGSSAPALSTGSAGTVSSGEFQFAYTYKDRDLAYESNGSSNYSTLTATDTGIINAVVPNSTDPQVDAIVLYGRKVSAGESVLRKISSQAQSAGTHSTIAVTSTAWTQNAEIPTDHNVPPVLSFGVVWKNRWWARSGTVTNRLHFTQLFLPQAWPALFYVDIPFERGDGIQAIVPLGDTLLIFGSTKIYIILGQTSLDFEVRPTIASEDGALGFRACAAIENGVVHVGAAGIYIFDGSTDKLLSHDLEPAWRDLIGNASVSDLQKVAVVYHQRQKELRVTVPRRYPSGTFGEWVLDLNRTRTTNQPAWTATDRTIGGYIGWDGPEAEAGDRGRLLSWHSTIGQLFEESVGTSANSSNITAEYEGPGLTLGAHRARWVDLRGEYEPHGGTVAVEPVIDGVSQGSQTVNIGAGLSVYGTGTYGSATYAGAGRRQFYLTLPLGADGRTFVLKVQYVGQEQWKLYTYHPGLVPETASRSFTE